VTVTVTYRPLTPYVRTTTLPFRLIVYVQYAKSPRVPPLVEHFTLMVRFFPLLVILQSFDVVAEVTTVVLPDRLTFPLAPLALTVSGHSGTVG